MSAKTSRFFALIFVAIAAVFIFTACADWFAPAQDWDREAFRPYDNRTDDRGNDTLPSPAPLPDAVPAPSPDPPPTPLPAGTLTPAQIFAKNQYAVFQILAFCVNGFWYYGSGFFIDSTGVAVTNHHVMVNMVEAFAVLYDDSYFEITGFYSYDKNNDLAVIHVDGGRTRFNYVTLGNSDAVRVGEPVFAMGGPEGEPITFTDGMISRLVAEPISIDIYTVSGLLQHTAAIYGGNSGGPLINDRGQVIGINSFVRTDRASVQWAVPSNRIALPRSGDTVRPLPIGTQMQPTFDGRVTYLTRFNFIPDILSISRNARLQMSGTPADLGETSGIIYDLYDYLYVYDLPAWTWIADTDEFDAALIQRGFIFQNIVHWQDEVWVYFFNPGRNISLSYAFMHDFDTLLVAIGRGDVYTLFYHTTPQPVPPTGQFGRDPALFGIWEFWESTNELYISWANVGERIFYRFEPDGTGVFATTDSLNTFIIRDFWFNWYTIDYSMVVIEYTTIDLVLVYYYFADWDGLLLLGDDEHSLIFY